MGAAALLQNFPIAYSLLRVAHRSCQRVTENKVGAGGSRRSHLAFDIEHTIACQCCNTSRRMNKEESDRIHELCSRIAVEHDHKKFLALVEELNRVLSARVDSPAGKQEEK